MQYLLALHIIAVVCWFAGLFYLPRLFVYHAMTGSKDVAEQFKVMEHKLYYYITMPAMVVTFLSGMILMLGYLGENPSHSGWLWLKVFLVLILLLFHFCCGHFMTEFKADRNVQSHKFYRYFNEVPSILLILIVSLAVLKPF